MKRAASELGGHDAVIGVGALDGWARGFKTVTRGDAADPGPHAHVGGDWREVVGSGRKGR